MSKNKKSNNHEILDMLINIAKYDKEQLDILCKEFDIMNPKSHKGRFAE